MDSKRIICSVCGKDKITYSNEKESYGFYYCENCDRIMCFSCTKGILSQKCIYCKSKIKELSEYEDQLDNIKNEYLDDIIEELTKQEVLSKEEKLLTFLEGSIHIIGDRGFTNSHLLCTDKKVIVFLDYVTTFKTYKYNYDEVIIDENYLEEENSLVLFSSTLGKSFFVYNTNIEWMEEFAEKIKEQQESMNITINEIKNKYHQNVIEIMQKSKFIKSKDEIITILDTKELDITQVDNDDTNMSTLDNILVILTDKRLFLFRENDLENKYEISEYYFYNVLVQNNLEKENTLSIKLSESDSHPIKIFNYDTDNIKLFMDEFYKRAGEFVDPAISNFLLEKKILKENEKIINTIQNLFIHRYIPEKNDMYFLNSYLIITKDNLLIYYNWKDNIYTDIITNGNYYLEIIDENMFTIVSSDPKQGAFNFSYDNENEKVQTLYETVNKEENHKDKILTKLYENLTDLLISNHIIKTKDEIIDSLSTTPNNGIEVVYITIVTENNVIIYSKDYIEYDIKKYSYSSFKLINKLNYDNTFKIINPEEESEYVIKSNNENKIEQVFNEIEKRHRPYVKSSLIKLLKQKKLIRNEKEIISSVNGNIKYKAEKTNVVGILSNIASKAFDKMSEKEMEKGGNANAIASAGYEVASNLLGGNDRIVIKEFSAPTVIILTDNIFIVIAENVEKNNYTFPFKLGEFNYEHITENNELIITSDKFRNEYIGDGEIHLYNIDYDEIKHFNKKSQNIISENENAYTIEKNEVDQIIEEEPVTTVDVQQTKNESDVNIKEIASIKIKSLINLMKIDGKLMDEEKKFIEDVIFSNSEKLGDELTEEIVNELETPDKFNIDYSPIKKFPEECLDLIDNLIALAKADGEFHIKEKLLIKQIGMSIGFSNNDIKELINS